MPDLLTRLAMTKLQAHETPRGGIAWAGVLTLDGEPYVHASNDGRGGCNDYVPVTGNDYRGMRAMLETVEAAAKEAIDLEYEAFDMLTACMENGMTARAAVTAYLAAG